MKSFFIFSSIFFALVSGRLIKTPQFGNDNKTWAPAEKSLVSNCNIDDACSKFIKNELPCMIKIT